MHSTRRGGGKNVDGLLSRERESRAGDFGCQQGNASAVMEPRAAVGNDGGWQ